MVDLKNCPFCGSSGEELMMFCDPEEGRDNSGPSRRIQCAVCNVEAPFYPSKAEAIAAWNRRALQAVGPEPAVAVNPLEWRKPDPENIMDHDDCQLVATGLGGQYAISERQLVRIKSPDNMGFLLWGAEDAFTFTEHLSVKAAKAAAQADYEQRIRSALEADTGGGEDWTVDDSLTARGILDYLGIGSDASLEPYADRRRDQVAKLIQKRVSIATTTDERAVEALTWIDVLREWFDGDRYARDYEYLDANFGEQAKRVAAYIAALAQGESRNG